MTLFHLKSVKSAPKVFTLFEFNLNKFLVILFLLNLILICGMHKTKRRLLLVILISIGVLTLTQPAPLIHNLYEGCWLCISTPYIGVGVYLTSYPYTSRTTHVSYYFNFDRGGGPMGGLWTYGLVYVHNPPIGMMMVGVLIEKAASYWLISSQQKKKKRNKIAPTYV